MVNGHLTDTGVYVFVIGITVIVVLLIWGAIVLASRMPARKLARVIALIVVGGGLVYAVIAVATPDEPKKVEVIVR